MGERFPQFLEVKSRNVLLTFVAQVSYTQGMSLNTAGYLEAQRDFDAAVACFATFKEIAEGYHSRVIPERWFDRMGMMLDEANAALTDMKVAFIESSTTRALPVVTDPLYAPFHACQLTIDQMLAQFLKFTTQDAG